MGLVSPYDVDDDVAMPSRPVHRNRVLTLRKPSASGKRLPWWLPLLSVNFQGSSGRLVRRCGRRRHKSARRRRPV